MNNRIPRMRTVKKAVEEIKKLDPGTSFTERALRRMITTKEIPIVEIGNKKLINLDLLLDKLSCDCYNENAICVS